MTRTILLSILATAGLLAAVAPLHAGMLYGVVQNSPNSQLVTIDTSTGATTQIGEEINGVVIDGLTLGDGGRLFGTSISSNNVFTIDTMTGATSDVAAVPAFTLRGLTFNNTNSTNGTLFVVGEAFTFGQPTTLYKIETSNNTVTTMPVGPLGFPVSGLTFDRSGTLYGVGFDSTNSTDQLLKIDSSTGEIIEVLGPLGVSGVHTLAFDTDGTLFGVDNGRTNPRLLTIDTSTGMASPGATLNITRAVTALAFQPSQTSPVPEPSSIALFSLGAIGMAFVAVRRRRKMQPAA